MIQQPASPLHQQLGIEHATLPSNDDNLDADKEEGVYRMVQNVLGQSSPRGLAPRHQEFDEFHVVSIQEPNNHTKALQSEPWLHAMEEEMSSILENKTWSLVDLSHGHRAIGLKWVYKVKRDEQGTWCNTRPVWWRRSTTSDRGWTSTRYSLH